MIPLLTLGIPGDAVTAVMLGALMVQGLQPGPLLFEHNADIVYTLFVGMIAANLVMIGFGLLGIRLFVKVLLVPKEILAPVILVLCIVGSYALGNNFFDVWVMFIAGIIGYFMLKYDFPLPLLFWLSFSGRMESSLRRALVMSEEH